MRLITVIGINGIINEERAEGRGKGRTGGLCFQVKLSLGVALSDGAGCLSGDENTGGL